MGRQIRKSGLASPMALVIDHWLSICGKKQVLLEPIWARRT